MLKKIRDRHYPAAFVDWMVEGYGREELMPDDDTIWLWSIAFDAGMRYGYQRGYDEGSADTEQLAKMDVI